MKLDRLDAVIGLMFLVALALCIAVAIAQSNCPNDCSPLVCRDDVRCMGAGVRR
jgi:hypothetical protein